MKILLDTSVYISFYRSGAHRELLHQLNSGHTLYLHAVVLAELHAGAKSVAFIKELRRLEKLFTLKGRVVVPEKRDYLTAGLILRKLGEASSLLPDALLAASARHEGMKLVTEDADFERIGKVQRFSFLRVKSPLH